MTTTGRDRARTSVALHLLGDVTSRSATGSVVAAVVVAWMVVGAVTAFPAWWLDTLEVVGTAVTLVMVFAIQHTQARQVMALQRKLDELLRASPRADDRVIGVEQGADGELLERAELAAKVRERAHEQASRG